MKKHLVRIIALATALMLFVSPAFALDYSEIWSIDYDPDYILYDGSFYDFVNQGILVYIPSGFHYETPSQIQREHNVVGIFWDNDYENYIGVLYEYMTDDWGRPINDYDTLYNTLWANPNVTYCEIVWLNGMMACLYTDLEYNSAYVCFLTDENGWALEVEYTPISDDDMARIYDCTVQGVMPR